MSSLTSILTGSFTSDGTAVNLSLPSGVQEFEMTNLTDIGSTAAATPVMTAQWVLGMDSGEAIYATKTNAAATIDIPTTTTSNGFTVVSDSGSTAPEAAQTVTAITNAAPPVVTAATTTGLADGDIVRMFNTTGQLNIAGLDFTIDNLNTGAGTFELINMAAPGAAATAGTYRRIPFNPAFYPRRRVITKITAASSALVTMSVTHGFTVGQKVRFIVPDACGMVEMDQLLGTITAIGTSDGVSTNTITVDIDSTAFTAFSFPSSAVAAAGVTFAQVVPVGEAAEGAYANLLDDATDNQSFRGLIIGTSVQTTGKLYRWVARRGIAI